jgi:hypothetical protein
MLLALAFAVRAQVSVKDMLCGVAKRLLALNDLNVESQRERREEQQRRGESDPRAPAADG